MLLRRPKGIRPRDMPIPKGVDRSKVVAILTGRNYQVATRVWMQDGHLLAARAIIDAGSGVSLIREDLLPKEMTVCPLDKSTPNMVDVNGNILPITGLVTLHVRIGTYETTHSLGVVQGMSVPLLLGTPYSDAHVPIISGPRNFIQLKDGCRVPILRRGKSVAPVATSTATPCNCSYKGKAKVQMAQQTIIEPKSKGYVKVQTAFQGNGLFTQRQRVFERQRLHVAPGTMTCKTGEPWWLELIHTGTNKLRLPKGMSLGTIEAYEGMSTVVTPEQWGKFLHDDAPTAPVASSKPVGNRENDPPIVEENVPESLRGRLKALIERHHGLWDGSLGTIKATKHRMRLKPGAKPMRLNPYRMGPRTRQLVGEQVDKMLKLDVIEPSTSEWASPVVLVPKPDGSTRFCIDYRQLNDRTVHDTYPLPRKDDCLDSLGDAKFFSTLDCKAGYWQIPVAKEDKHLTSFTNHVGTYQCTRLPFGLCNAPATFQRAIDMILAGVKWQYVVIYLDGIIVYSADTESHLSHLEKVFILLGENGVTLKEKKFRLFSNEVEYLGHVIRPGRISVNEKNLKAIRNAIYPKTRTQLRSFLGMFKVYRRVTADFAKVAKPLNKLVSSSLPKKLCPPTMEEQEAFDRLREQLRNPPILALPRREGKYIIDVDASYDQLGCALLQQQPAGEYHPVGYFSRELEPAEQSYTVTEIEGLGVVWEITSLRPYVEGTRFLVRCDHKALKWILTTTACTNNRLNRWRIRLAEFDYDVEYKPGRQHAIADALSRMPTEGLDTTPIPDAIPVVGVTTRSGAVLEPRRPENKGQVPISMAELAKEQLADSFCQEIRQDMDTMDRTRFYENGDGMLCRHSQQEGTQQVDVPRSLVADVLEREDSSPLGGHPGETKKYRTLRRRYYWP